MTKIGLSSLDTLTNVFVKTIFIVKFRVCEHDMPFTLEKIIKVEVIEHLEGCYLSTETVCQYYHNA